MENTHLIGRTEEIRILHMCQDSAKSEFVAVYGRRRFGKTFLLKETLGTIIDFEFSGMYNVPGKVQLNRSACITSHRSRTNWVFQVL